MNTDHYSKEKKDARLLEALKAWAVDQHLGEEKMLEMTLEEICDYFKKAEEEIIRKAGGANKWNKLSDIKKAERKAKMIEEAVAELGKEEFNNLSDEEKRLFRLFIWAGCGCHKDLNTIRGGYLAMYLGGMRMDLRKNDLFFLPIMIMILWFKSEKLLLGRVTPQPQLKKELFTNQHVVLLKLQKMQVQSSIIKTKKRATMISFVIGGGNMWEFHLHFLIHPTIDSSHTVMLLQLFSFIQRNSRIFLRVYASTSKIQHSIIWNQISGRLSTALQQ
jgi:hypothetical protein